jgi:probable HAF family extracellular repeat protein
MAPAGFGLVGGVLVVATATLAQAVDAQPLDAPSRAADETARAAYSLYVLSDSSVMYGEGLSLNNSGQVAASSDTRDGGVFVWSPGVGAHGLPVPRGDVDLYAPVINDKGQVAGDLLTDDGWSAFLWDPVEGMSTFGTPAGAFVTWTSDVNNHGQAIGAMNVTADALHDSEVDTHNHAFVWDATNGIRDLGTLPGGLDSRAVDINDKGQVVGTFDLPPDSDGACCSTHAVLWDPVTGIRDLGALPGGGRSEAVAINQSGQVVGDSEGHAFLWDPVTGMRDLGPGQAVDINDKGQVVGTYWGEGPHGGSFVWDPSTGNRDLGTLPGWTGDIRAMDINNLGQVAGYLYTSSHPDRGPLPNRAFMWDPVAGIRDLGGLGTGDYRAFAINDKGQVAGITIPDGGTTRTLAVMWSPPSLWVPTSTTLKAKSYFGLYSTTLTRTEKLTLRDLVSQIPPGAVVTARATGMVRADGATKADKQRALKRAKAVRKFLTKLDLTGTITVSNHGRTNSTTKKARRVTITITYTQ